MSSVRINKWIYAAIIWLAGSHCAAHAQLRVKSFQPVEPLARAQRDADLCVQLSNTADTVVSARAQLVLPSGLALVQGPASRTVTVGPGSRSSLVWRVRAAKPGFYALKCTVNNTVAKLDMLFLPSVQQHKLSYIPAPQPVHTDILVGAHNCPLWEADKYSMWDNILKHPERTPALGFYAQENPEVADWETKWAVEHGVSFFVYCWYRASQGGPVKTHFGSAIHESLYKSRFASKMKYTIMWENQSRGTAGVSDEHDLMTNLLPFWINTYFKNPSYLKVDNKPVLFIYRPEYLVQDLGSVQNVVSAFNKMRQACKEAGFDGLTILGEYRGTDPNMLQYLKNLGLDYSFAYCWPVDGNPTPERAVETQMQYIRETQRLNVLPQVVTVSQAWSGWNDEGTIWKIPPPQFEGLLRQAKQFIEALPKDQLSSRMLLLDNWNEWGEGHYIAPYREFGFGYLDAVRRVFSNAPEQHTDLLPVDIGMGPYDTAYKKHAVLQQRIDAVVSRKVVKPGANDPGLIAWWAFDDAEEYIAADFSGHRLGASVTNMKHVAGIDGKALNCQGGWALVSNAPQLSPTSGITIECWVKAAKAGQANNWIVNRVFSDDVASGYRLGVLNDKPCFEIPLTAWSHHLTADVALEPGRWTHLLGTFDGETMRIYVDGVEHGSMERKGAIKPNACHLCIGNYESGHNAFFHGLLDEVKLYDRALTPDEVRAHFRQLAAKAGTH